VTASKAVQIPAARADAHRQDFAAAYRANVGAIAAYFARRCREPQEVADLTSQTFVEALGSLHTYAGRGSVRAWLIAIARRVYARHVADRAEGTALIDRLGGQLVFPQDEIDELADRLDARRDGQDLLVRAAHLSALEREAIELVDLVGLAPREAARVLGVSANTLRVRLFRAHAQLRKETDR
jgi:RNA polymerase sigma factor (sigma-70 family)